MVHTLPDYTTKYKTAIVFGNLDHAELAARLGSINRFDRRGHVVWMDNFEAPKLKWSTYTTGTGGKVQLSTEYSRSGSQSCMMKTGDAVSNYAYMRHHEPLPTLTRLGLEVSFTMPTTATQIYWSITVYDGDNEHTARVYYYTATGKLELLGENNSIVQFATKKRPYEIAGKFNTIKLVMDYGKEEYVRFIFNEETFDISSYRYAKGHNTTPPDTLLIIQIQAAENAASTMYIDDVIFTQNEP